MPSTTALKLSDGWQRDAALLDKLRPTAERERDALRGVVRELLETAPAARRGESAPAIASPRDEVVLFLAASAMRTPGGSEAVGALFNQVMDLKHDGGDRLRTVEATIGQLLDEVGA